MGTAANNLSNVWFKVTDLEIQSGEGSWVTTTDGTRYLDFSGGIAVTSTGHAHPAVVAAIQEQAARAIHLQANIYTHDLLQPLAARLTELAPGAIDTFFFANSGAEITEAAIKLAKQATGRPHTIVFRGSFHGRTHQTMAMTTSKSLYRAGYAPLPSGVFIAPFPDIRSDDPDGEVDRALAGFDYLLDSVTAPGETAAAIIEPVLGEGGYSAAPNRFLRGLSERCAQHGIMFIADEVQSGFGRTGKMFAIEYSGVEPDIICMAKGIASGFPLSALGTRRELDDRWPTGSHGGTYGGNPIGCAAALATIDVITAEGFLDAVNAKGARLLAGVEQLAAANQGIRHTRGIGLMVGVEFESGPRLQAVIAHALRHSKVILMSAGAQTLRFMPPLTVTDDEIDVALEAVAAGLAATS